MQEGEARTIDARFQLRSPLQQRSDLVVVAIDDATDRAWKDIPKAMWTSGLARLVERLDEDGVRRIGLDFVISSDPDSYLSAKGIDETPNSDLDRSIVQTGERVLLGSSQEGDVIAPLDVPDRLASVNVEPDASGTVRRLPLWDPSFHPPIRALSAVLAGVSENRQDPIFINYSGRLPTVVSAVDVIEGRVPVGLLRGAIVIVGETYSGTPDHHQTPFEPWVPGVFIHAEAIRTLLDGNELRVWPLWVASLAAFLASLLGSLLARRVWVGPYYAAAFVIAAVWTGACMIAFGWAHSVLPWLSPMIALLVLAPGATYSMRALEEYHERLDLRARWGRLLGRTTMDRLEQNRRSGLGPWGQFDCCVMFMDVADFSSLTRITTGGQMVSLLNRLFTESVNIIESTGGEVIGFMGDGLAAKWERQPESQSAQHDIVLSAALKILAGVDRLNSQDAFQGHVLDVRIGLSSGTVTLALIGSSARQQMTLYGEAVNLAARLESAGKDAHVNSRLMTSIEYGEAVTKTGRKFDLVETMLKGWDQPIPFWRLARSTDDEGMGTSAHQYEKP